MNRRSKQLEDTKNTSVSFLGHQRKENKSMTENGTGSKNVTRTSPQHKFSVKLNVQVFARCEAVNILNCLIQYLAVFYFTEKENLKYET